MDDRITKIRKHSDGSLEVVYEGLSQLGTVQIVGVRSHDAPKEKFDGTLQRLRLYLCDLLNIDREWKKGLEITGLTIKYSEDKNTGQTIIDQVILAEKSIGGLKPLKISTPGTYFSGTAAMDIDDLCEMAMAFAHGERAQLTLPFPEGDTRPTKHGRPRKHVANVGGVH